MCGTARTFPHLSAGPEREGAGEYLHLQLCFPPRTSLLCAVLGLLNPLDSPHHMRVDEDLEYREGVVLDRPTKPGKGSFVNCGMRKVCLLPTGAKTTSLVSLADRKWAGWVLLFLKAAVGWWGV